MEQAELNAFRQSHMSNSSTAAEQVESFHQELQDFVMEDDVESLCDSMVCDFGGRLIPSGFRRSGCTDEYVMFINAGGEALIGENSDIEITGDKFYEGGNVLRTNEQIAYAGCYQSLYQSARLGNFYYKFNSLPPGEYIVDLHFAEIINTNGPKGIRVFNVYIQEEKVLSDFDIFAIVGANNPLQLIDARVSVKDNGLLLIRFESVHGSSAVCSICVRKASKLWNGAPDFITCTSCAAPIAVPLAQKKHMQAKTSAKYEKKIEELKTQCQLKTKECHEAWMSLTTTNQQLDMARMELDNLTFKTMSLDQTMERQGEKLRNVSSRYEQDKKCWGKAVNDLQGKIKLMKRKHCQLSGEAHECIDTIPDLSKMVFAVQALVLQCEDLKMKYSEEMKKRRKLFNEVQEAKGNIRVFCRCRPLSKREIVSGCIDVVDFDSAKDGCLGILTGSTKKTFRFDRVYSPNNGQVDVFADASPMVVSVLDGYNVCIFAYGQTGTGKTFTMEGTEQNRGVNYRTLEQLFEIAKERSEAYKYNISVSVLEVYNEQIRDLLSTKPTTKKLDIKQASEGFHHIPGITEAKVENIKEVWNVLQAGSNARAVGSNNVNEHSSRSHCMLCISVKAKNLMNGDFTKSKLWLVDLAGSERLAKTDVQGERLKEAQNINRSLSALGDVISALANKSSHIPYRNSKLTHLLQDSLGGDAKTLMFVQISPSDQDLGETLSSLNFATRVRGVELGPVRKQTDNGELQKLTMLEKVRCECKTKDESLRKLEESLQNLENKLKSKDHNTRSMQDNIKELEGQIELQIALHNQSQRHVSQVSDRLKGKEETCNNLQRKVRELENRLREQQQSNAEASQEKVRDLEHKLKEQLRESESQSGILRHEIKELERKLKDQERNSDLLLQQKMKDLEEKFRQPQQQPLTDDMLDAAAARATPHDGKSCIKNEVLSEIESHNILRCSNSVNRLSSQSTKSGKGNDYVPQIRSKRIDEENRVFPSAYESRVTRKSDPPKVLRVTRPTRQVVNTAQHPLSHKSVSRDQVQRLRETDSKKIWSR